MRDAIDELVELIYDPEREIQEMAVQALGEIGGQRVRSALIELQVVAEGDQALQELVEDAQANIRLVESILDVASLNPGTSSTSKEHMKDQD